MNSMKLTACGSGATTRTMRRGLVILSGSVAAPVMLGGCININAPAEPIVIELNINIRQEVIYRLAEDVDENIEENAEIF
jgi:hypothetical protein